MVIITGKSMNCCWHITFSPWTEPGTSGAAHDAGKGGHPEMPVWQEVPGENCGTYNGNRHRYLIWKIKNHIDFMFWNIIYIYLSIYLEYIWKPYEEWEYIYIYICIFTYIYIYIWNAAAGNWNIVGIYTWKTTMGILLVVGSWDGDHALGLSQYQPDDYWVTLC